MKSFKEILDKANFNDPKNLIKCCSDSNYEGISNELRNDIDSLNKILKYEKHEFPVIFIGMGTCGLASGAQKVKDAIVTELEKLNLTAEIVPTGCIGFCAKEVIVDIKLPGESRISYCEVTTKDIPSLIRKTIVEQDVYQEKLLGAHNEGVVGVKYLNDIPFFRRQRKIVLKNCGIIDPTSIDEYIASGGFKALDIALNSLSPLDVVNEVSKSGLRGRGGGGFPTGKKWEFAYKQADDIKYIICNADEGDPGAFMDRSILESDPFRLVEGMIIGASVTFIAELNIP